MNSLLTLVFFLVSASAFAGDFDQFVGRYQTDCSDLPSSLEIIESDGALHVGPDVEFSNINEGVQVRKMNTETGYIRTVTDTETFSGPNGIGLMKIFKSVNFQMWVIPTDRFSKLETLHLTHSGALTYTAVNNGDDSTEVTCRLIHF